MSNGANATNPLFSRSTAWTAAARTGFTTRRGTVRCCCRQVATAAQSPRSRRAHDRRDRSTLNQPVPSALLTRPALTAATDRPDFVVHHGGEHRGQLDLKRGGLAPVVALGRWIAIVTGDARGTTPQRLQRGAEAGLLTKDEAHMLALAFEDVYSLVMGHEVQAIRSGTPPTTFIIPKDLDGLTRRHLRGSFRAIGHVQTRLDQEWITRLNR
jgi:CBS domain-containing protein